MRPDDLAKVIGQEPKDETLEDAPAGLDDGKKIKRRSSALPKSILWGVLGLVVLFVGGSAFSWYAFRGKVIGAITENIGTLRAGVDDLQNLDTRGAAEKFSSFSATTTDWNGYMNIFGSLFAGGKQAIASFADLSNQLGVFAEEVGALEGTTFDFLARGQGSDLIAQLNKLRDTVDAVHADTNGLSSAASFAGGLSSLGGADVYLSLKTQVEGMKRFLDTFVPWLSDPGTHHMLVLLQNPSEMRPAGGFLGSYADVTITGGSIARVDVHDIADVDLAFKKKIIPPKPIQLEVTNWRPADANWFFDFPTSASKTIQFFEESDLYANTSTTFDGAIAVSPRVIQDLLGVTGPIAVGKPTTTFASSTLLIQIQKIVQDGQWQNATYPKQILRDLSSALLTRLASSTDEQKKELITMVGDWITKKDVMVYFKDPVLESSFDTYGASGGVYDLPQKFNGDYLAVVDANINGQKTDLYVTSTVVYSGQINLDGTLGVHLAITRKHSGNKSPYSWYKATNNDYLQLFVPDGSTLANASGGLQKKITAPINYEAKGYLADPLVAAIEGTEQSLFSYPTVAWHEDAGKKVFTTWSTVKAGASAQITFDYAHRLFIQPDEGVEYQFVFEKQTGTVRHYDLTMNAPLGYVFAENHLPSYEYVSDDPPGRVSITLTLTKLSL